MTDYVLPSQEKARELYHDFVVKTQEGLTAIPAIGPTSGGDGEYKKAEFIKKYLTDTGIKYDSLEEINAPDNRVPNGYRPNLIVKINGKSDKKTIWIMGHMDIVPPGDSQEWITKDPYKAVEQDGKIYGRGTEDNQQAIVASLLAAKMLQDNNLKPAYNLGLLFVADEETGSSYGVEYILEKKPELFGPDDMVIVPDSGDPEGVLIEVAEKSILWVKCETIGKSAHGSTPDKGINALRAGARLVVKIDELYNIFNQKDDVYDPPISTFAPTKKEANVDNINTIPAKDVFYIDCRILPTYNIEDVKNQIRSWANDIEKEFGVTISLSYPQEKTAPTPTPVDAPIVNKFKKAIKDVTGKEGRTIGIGGGTVAACFREINLHAVCWSNLDETLHQPNEYCKIDNVITDAMVFANIALQD